MWTQAILAVVGGSVGAALVTLLDHRLTHKEERQDKQEDMAAKDFEGRLEKLEGNIKSLEAQNTAIMEALKLIMLDRIIALGKRYIAAGSVTVDEKRRLAQMYNCYHGALGGNGDADLIMGEVEKLRIKEDDAE